MVGGRFPYESSSVTDAPRPTLCEDGVSRDRPAPLGLVWGPNIVVSTANLFGQRTVKIFIGTPLGRLRGTLVLT